MSGTATLRDAAGGAEVELNMRDLPEAGGEHIVHVHGGGTCADVRAGNPAPMTTPLDSMTAEEDGTGTATTALEDVTVAELQSPSEQESYIAVHAVQEEGGGFPPTISCADLATVSGEQTVVTESTVTLESTNDLPKSGDATIGNPSVLLPAVALLLGSGVLVFALVRRR